MPRAGKQELRMTGTNCQIRDADFWTLIENFGPMLSAVDGFVDATLLVRTVDMSQSADIDESRVLRVDDDPADMARVLQSDVEPASTAIDGLVDTVAEGESERMSDSPVPT